MNFQFLTLADSAATTGKTPAGPNMIVMIIFYVVIFGALYFFMFRPQKKRQKEEKLMRENLQVGDEVVTIGGIHGKVISLKEDTMVIESQVDRSKMTVARWALQTNLTVHDQPAQK